MRNTELSEIGDEFGGLQKREIAIELQAVRGKRYQRRSHVFRNHIAERGGTRSEVGMQFASVV